MTQIPATASLAEFAKLAGFKRSYITQLKADDRLILTPDGKQVRVAESLRRIEDTRDPAKIGVVQRHAAEREAAAADVAPEAEGPHAPTQPDVGAKGGDRATGGYQAARAVKERYLAMQAKRDYEISIGQLLDANDVLGAIRMHVATLRTGLEALPDMLAAQLTGVRDETRARSLIADAIQQKLDELSRQLGAIGRTEHKEAA